MTKKALQELTDEELQAESKKIKQAKIINATLIGVFVGIIIWSVVKSAWGFFTLIPLFFIYKLANNTANAKELEELMKERNLN